MKKIHKIIVKYPPDFDGELHIHCLETEHEYEFHLHYAKSLADTPTKALKNISRDILKNPVHSGRGRTLP